MALDWTDGLVSLAWFVAAGAAWAVDAVTPYWVALATALAVGVFVLGFLVGRYR